MRHSFRLPFSANIAPLAMLFGSLLFLSHGGGIYSMDAVRVARADIRDRPPGS